MESLAEKELICLINKLVDEKIDNDENFLRFTFYEVIVKNKVINKQEIDFITLAKNKLNNMGYSVYLQDQEFIYKDKNMKVQTNELLVAIKDKNRFKFKK